MKPLKQLLGEFSVKIFMNIVKIAKDQAMKWILRSQRIVPRELLELNQYFRLHGGINFAYKKSDEGYIVARSTDFRYGSIITSGKNEQEIDRNIKDAILTSFEIPSVYSGKDL